MKLSYSDCKDIKKMDRKTLSIWVEGIYKAGYEAGYNDCSNNGIDFELMKIAIKATEGIGDVLYKRLVTTIEKLCFCKEECNAESKDGTCDKYT